MTSTLPPKPLSSTPPLHPALIIGLAAGLGGSTVLVLLLLLLLLIRRMDKREVRPGGGWGRLGV